MPISAALGFASALTLTIQFLIFTYLYSSHRVRFFRYLLIAWGLMSIVRAVGNDLRWDYTAVGMPTHIAARMEQVAAPGAILVTAETLELVKQEVRARSIGRVAIKGVSEGLAAHELLGFRTQPELSRGSVVRALRPELSV